MKRTEFETPSAESAIFNIIRTGGPINRTDIVARTGFSKSTISLQIGRLIQRGLIREEQPEDDGRPRRNLRLEIRSDAGYVAGVFLGIHKLCITLFNLGMDAIRESRFTLESVIDPDETNRFIVEKIRDILEAAGVHPEALWGIGLGFPFPVDFEKGIPDSPPNLPLWHSFPLKSLYEEAFGCPVLIDNDVNVMALGEGFSGVAQDEKDFIFLKVGTGIGAGLFLDGRIYRGSKGCAGDIGHIALDGETKLCHCGNAGCLETIAGAPAIAAKGFAAAMTEESPLLAAVLKQKNRITSEDVGDSAQRGDMFSIQIIQESGRHVGSVLAKLVNFSNPALVVIGGGVAGAGTIFLTAIRESILRRSTHLATIDLNVRFSELREQSGPTGAGRLILEEIFSSSRFAGTVEREL